MKVQLLSLVLLLGGVQAQAQVGAPLPSCWVPVAEAWQAVSGACGPTGFCEQMGAQQQYNSLNGQVMVPIFLAPSNTCMKTVPGQVAGNALKVPVYNFTIRTEWLDSNVFDYTYYVTHNTDLRQGDGSAYTYSQALAHWIQHGIGEGRQATQNFIASEYLGMYGDLQNAFGANNYKAAIIHYINYGIREGRGSRIFLRSEVFNAYVYLATYPDLQAAFGANNYDAATTHWLTYGIHEGRSGLGNYGSFRAAAYLAHYADLTRAFGATNYPAAIRHYIEYGIREGRQGY